MKIFNSIKFKVTLGVFVLVTATTVLLSVVSYTYEKRAIRNRVYAQLCAIADLKKKLIITYLNERMSDLNTLAAFAYPGEQVGASVDVQSPSSLETTPETYSHLGTIHNITYAKFSFKTVSKSGVTIITTDRDPKGAPRAADHESQSVFPKYAEALKHGGALFLQDHVNENHIDLARGILNKHGELRTIIIHRVNLEEMIFPLFSDYTGLGLTGETLLVRRTESRGSHINPTRHQPLSGAARVFQHEESSRLAELAILGNEGIDQGIDYRGSKVIGAYRYISSLGWGIVVKIDADEAFAEITALRKKTALLATVILALMLVVVYVAVWKLTSPIDRLIETTKAVSVGRYEPLPKSGRTDEIGELEDNFNQMVSSLGVASRLAEMKQEDLEQKVRERTESLAQTNTALSAALQDIRREGEEKKSLQKQLLHAQKMEAIGTLAGGVAHEFNNILMGIIGYCNLIGLKLQDTDPLRDYLNQITATSERAASLTHSLLAFSKRQIVKPQPLSLNRLVERTLRLLDRLMGEHIEIRSTLAEADLMIMADSGQLEHVVMNLATNARDAMPEGGVFTITTSIEDIDEQYIALHGFGTVGKYAVVMISDTGIGIDEQTQSRIFEPFFTTKEVGKGTGLGLAIVYGIIKSHEGYINCYSDPGKGTSFKLYLPLLQAQTPQQYAAESLPLQGGHETILVAEDNTDVRRLVHTVLSEFGYTVIEAVDGEDAVKKFSKHGDTVQLLLFDVIMPKKNGKNAYEEIKKVRPDIKVIFTSGYTADIIRQQSFLDEGLILLTKPLSPRELLINIRSVLDQD